MNYVSVLPTWFLTVCILSFLSPAAGEEIAGQTDPRLDQKLTIKAIGKPLGEFLTSLSVKTGVKFTAREDVADHKFSVLVRDLTLADLMVSIEKVLHLRQTANKGKDGKLEYELWEDAKTKDEAGFRKTEARNMLAKQMNRAADVVKLPEEQIQQEMKEDPLLGPFIGEEHFRTAVEVYSLFDNQQRARLWETKTAKVPLTDLPKDLQESILEIFEEDHRRREQMENIKLTGTLGSMLFEVQEDPFASKALAFHMMGTDNVGLTLLFQASPEFGPDLLGNEELFALKENPDTHEYEAIAKQIEGRLAEKSKVKLDEEVTLPRALLQIADAEDIDIVADHFTPRYSMASKVEKWGIAHGNTLAYCIERIAGVFACRWTMQGTTCLLTSKHWFQDRDTEISQKAVRRWQKAFQQNGRFELRELKEIATLEDTQLKALRFYGLFCPAGFYHSIKPLRFAAGLAPDQWESATADEGLPSEKLTEDQKRMLVQWIEAPVGSERQPSGLSEADVASATVQINQKDADTWVFRVETPDGRTREDVLKLK